MKAEALNRWVIVQRKTVVYNPLNEPIPAWSTLCRAKSAVITTGGREFYAAQKLHAETSALFIMRYRSDITTLDRILFGAKVFEILALNDVDAANRWLHISAKEVV